MEDDIQLMHYVVRKGIAEHRQLVRYNQELRGLLLESIMAHEEERASGLMDKFMELNRKFKESACLDSSE